MLPQNESIHAERKPKSIKTLFEFSCNMVLSLSLSLKVVIGGRFIHHHFILALMRWASYLVNKKQGVNAAL
jgi:hypothetical protein